MPAWGQINEGGSLNEQEINNVITFIQYGDWDQRAGERRLGSNLDKPLPDYSAKGWNGGQADDAKLAQVKRPCWRRAA